MARVSEASETAENMDSYKQKYEDLLAEYQDFAYAVSHDLQAPVRMMSGFTEILLQELDDDLTEHLTCYSDMIKHAGKEASEALDALLEFSRLTTDEKFYKPLEVNDVLSTVLETVAGKIKAAGATVNVDDLPPTYGDYGLLCRLYTYLISNALKFRHAERETVINIGVKDGYYFVKDNGIGMKPERVSEAMIMFRKLNAEDAYPGRGAGLSFSKKIIDIHKGELKIETAPDEGTTVFFTLERTEDDLAI